MSFNLIDRAGIAIASLSGVDRVEKSQEFDGASGLNRFSIELKPFGGALVIRRPESPQPDVPVAGCGNVERFRKESGELGGASFSLSLDLRLPLTRLLVNSRR